VVSPVRPSTIADFLPHFHQGVIPESLGNLGNLKQLLLGDNKLEGSTPPPNFLDGQSHPTADIPPFFSCEGKEEFKKSMVKGTWFCKIDL